MRSLSHTLHHSLHRFLGYALLSVGLGLIGMSAHASPFAPQNGAEYLSLQTPQSTEAGNKIEVIEFFAYFCPHCYRFEPAISEWATRNSDKVVFKRIHVNFHDSTTQQKLFFTLEAMNKVAEFQKKAFDAYHVENNHLESDADVALFVTKSGLDKKKFFDIYNSFSIQSKVKRATQQQEAYRVDGVPQLVIDGRFVTSPLLASVSMGRVDETMSGKAAIQVLDYLVSRVAKSKVPAATPVAAKVPAPAAPVTPAKKK